MQWTHGSVFQSRNCENADLLCSRPSLRNCGREWTGCSDVAHPLQVSLAAPFNHGIYFTTAALNYRARCFGLRRLNASTLIFQLILLLRLLDHLSVGGCASPLHFLKACTSVLCRSIGLANKYHRKYKDKNRTIRLKSLHLLTSILHCLCMYPRHREICLLPHCPRSIPLGGLCVHSLEFVFVLNRNSNWNWNSNSCCLLRCINS